MNVCWSGWICSQTLQKLIPVAHGMARDASESVPTQVAVWQSEGRRGGRKVPLKANADEALLACPSIRSVIVAKNPGGAVDMMAAAEWPGVAADDALLRPGQCRTLWRQFLSDSTFTVQQVGGGGWECRAQG